MMSNRASSILMGAVLVTGCASATQVSPEKAQARVAEFAPGVQGDYLAIEGGACLGDCPNYQIYVFETGEVIFRGLEYTVEKGTVRSRIDPGGYKELKEVVKDLRVFAPRIVLVCRTDYPVYRVTAASSKEVRIMELRTGCGSQEKIADQALDAFVRISNSKGRISK